MKIKLYLFAALAVLLVIASIFSESLCPYDPYEHNLDIALQAPSAEHIMGTDSFGRDMFSRVIIGSRISVLSTLALVAFISVFGLFVGVICGYFGGTLDTVVMRISDLFLAFPGLVFALAIAALLGGGVSKAVFALAAISWPKYARVARSQVLSVKSMPYISAATMAGSSHMSIIMNHIIPNILGPVLVTSVLDIGTMMMELAGLSFLGLGAKPPAAEWGSMMSNGRSMLQTYPWTILSPGIAIFVCVVIFNLFGDALRDVLDPKNQGDGV